MWFRTIGAHPVGIGAISDDQPNAALFLQLLECLRHAFILCVRFSSQRLPDFIAAAASSGRNVEAA